MGYHYLQAHPAHSLKYKLQFYLLDLSQLRFDNRSHIRRDKLKCRLDNKVFAIPIRKMNHLAGAFFHNFYFSTGPLLLGYKVALTFLW